MTYLKTLIRKIQDGKTLMELLEVEGKAGSKEYQAVADQVDAWTLEAEGIAGPLDRDASNWNPL